MSTLHDQIMNIGHDLVMADKHHRRSTHSATDLIKANAVDSSTGKYKASLIFNQLKSNGEWPLDPSTNKALSIKGCMASQDPDIAAFGRACNVLSATASRLNRPPRVQTSATSSKPAAASPTTMTTGAVMKAYAGFTDEEKKEVFLFILSLPPKNHLRILKEAIKNAAAAAIKKTP